MSHRVKKICLDTNMLDKIIDYHYKLVHNVSAGRLPPEEEKIYLALKNGQAKLCVPPIVQEEMIWNKGYFQQFVRFLSDMNASLVPCATDNFLKEIEKFIFPNESKINLNNNNDKWAKKLANIDHRYKEQLKSAKEDMSSFYEKEKAKAERVKSKPQYWIKKDVGIVLMLYYIDTGLMLKNDIFDISILESCVLEGIDEYYTKNVKDYGRVKQSGIAYKNREFVNWFERNKHRNLNKICNRILSKVLDLEELQKIKNFEEYKKRLYYNLGIHEKNDADHLNRSMKARIPRLLELLGITEENFNRRLLDLGKNLRNWKLRPDNLTDTQLITIKQ